MIKYAKIINEETKACEVGTGTNSAFYTKLGMTEMDVEQDSLGGWYLTGYVPEKTYTQADYENAMEEHLTTTRTERGYTVREPSAYINSSNARWAQDAQDWCAFVDSVMEYGLTVLNSGDIPDFEEFKAGLPVITWSYDEVGGESDGV